MHVENIGDVGIHLSRVQFHPEQAWDVNSSNEVSKDVELSVFDGRLLGPREVYQTMHVLSPKIAAGEGEMPFTLGRVEINWIGSMGEKASTITGVMKRKLTSHE